MTLAELLVGLPESGLQVIGNLQTEISSLHFDPLKVTPGGAYFCLEQEEFQEPHLKPSGLDHWGEALDRGAVCLFTSKAARINPPAGVVQVVCWHLNQAMALIAKRFYGDPYAHMRLIGITGTNGKTTTCQILDGILTHAKFKAGVIGTIGTFYPDSKEPPTHLSNPLAIDLFAIGARMKKAEAQAVMMEVTSHAMDYDRNHALDYDIAIFTNLTQDHLDHHHSMEAYLKAKVKFFKQLGQGKKKAVAIVNLDDPYAGEFVVALDDYAKRMGRILLVTYGIRAKNADLRATPIEMTGKSSRFQLTLRGNDLGEVRLPMAGTFNIYNAVAAFAAGLAMDIRLETLIQGLERARQIDGRFEKIESPKGTDIFIDYAHTPDALEKILKEIMSLCRGRGICVFGCGGDRDATKRPIMGAIASKYADQVVVTSDNPRTEDPQKIALEIAAGIAPEDQTHLYIELDRAKAIALALEMAGPMDSVLIAGKGHETYQIIGHQQTPFSDRVQVRAFFERHKEPHFRAQVEINPEQIRQNLRLILAEKPAQLSVMAVVKDEALGHGLVQVAKIAQEEGLAYLGVACMEEAIALRQAGLAQIGILVFGERQTADLELALQLNLDLQVQSLERAQEISRVALELGKTARLHLKVDTGMGRYGVLPEKAARLFTDISGLPQVELIGLFTHFAQSDEAEKAYAHLQWQRFEKVLKELASQGIKPPLVHAANSGGYLDLPFAHGDMVRIGALLTGVYPSEVCRRIKGLAPAMEVKAKVAFVKELGPGDKVGYGMHWTAEAPAKIAVLPIGYGDGYPRIRNKGFVLLHGKRCPIRGGNSMDALMVEVTGLPVHPGDEVVLLGKQGDEEITAMEIARGAGTVTYQILSCWTNRMPKRWL